MTAFDTLAPTYDTDFTESSIARWLRARTHERLDALFQPDDTVLELGCGTGEDALHLARRGVRVIATDASEAMLKAAREKTAGEPLVQVEKLDLLNIPPPSPPPQGGRGVGSTTDSSFDGVYSNFGALNCVNGWRALAAWLAARVKPRGRVAFGVMSPLCVWEIAWHGVHGEFGTAMRRLSGQATFQPRDGEGIAIYYPTVRRLERDFAPYFRRVRVRPLGLFLPPSDVYGVIEKRPRLLQTLTALEARFGHWGTVAMLADHYWIEMERTTVAVGEMT